MTPLPVESAAVDTWRMTGGTPDLLRTGSRVRLHDGRHANVTHAFAGGGADDPAAVAYRVVLDDGTVAAVSIREIAALIVDD